MRETDWNQKEWEKECKKEERLEKWLPIISWTMIIGGLALAIVGIILTTLKEIPK